MKPKQKPNGIYYIDVQVPDGTGNLKRQRISLDTRDLVDANEQAKQWQLGIHPKHWSQGAVVEPKKRKDDTSISQTVRAKGYTMEQLFDRCHTDPEVWGKVKSQPTIRSNIRLLNARLGTELVSTMTRKRLQLLVDDLRDAGYAPGSIKRKMDMIGRALRMAAEFYEDDKGNPLIVARPTMPKITVNNTKDRYLQPNEDVMVFAALDARILKEPQRPWTRFKMFVTLLLDTAFRRGEALTLGTNSIEMGRIETDNGVVDWPFIRIAGEHTKNGKPHMVPASQRLAEMIPALNAQAIGGKWFPLAASAWYMWTNIRDDVEEMGGDISDVGLHTLRHTCLTRLALGGMELQRLSMWANHSDVSITAARYSHLSPTALAGGIAILGTTGGLSTNSTANPELPAIAVPSINGGIRANSGTAHLN